MTSRSYRRILVAINGSREASAGLERAIMMAPPGEAEIFIIGVVESPLIEISDAGPWEIAKLLQEEEASLVHHLERARRRLEDTGRSTQPQLFRGSARAIIVEQAKELGVDLVVLGGPDHGFLECGLRGCTACWVVKHVSCSTLIVREQTSGSDRRAQEEG